MAGKVPLPTSSRRLRHSFIHVLSPFTNILYEAPGNPRLDSFANKELWVLILVDVLQSEAI